MIDERPSFERMRGFAADVCVVGGGPVGILTALALERQGLRVLLLESGGQRGSREAQALSQAENLRPENHHAPEITVARRLGGAANLWGGRCVPYDPVDFGPRPWLDRGNAAWPIGEAELAPYLEPACTMLEAGGAVFRAPLAGVEADDAFDCEALERWSNVPRIQAAHRRKLARNPRLLVALGATALGFGYDAGGAIDRVALHLEGQGRGEIPVHRVILAAGGNESTRLLLAEARRSPGLFGGEAGPLGRFYMGHLNGQIADIAIENRRFHDALDFFVDAHGSYVRRRLIPSAATQAAAGLANVAFWPVVPRIADPEHGSGALSAVFLALAQPGIGRRLIAESLRLKHVGPPPHRFGEHLLNVLRDPVGTLAFGPRFLWKNKVARHRLPGLFLANPTRRYGLEFHAEHLPREDNRLTLSEETDRLGLPRLRIDLRFFDDDAASVVRAHAALDAWLARNGLGRLDYRVPEAERIAAILETAKHGNHQIGTIRMGETRRDGVVDRDCRAFDVPNLHVVSTAVLPSSGQASPTLTAVQLGLRLADRLARSERPVLGSIAGSPRRLVAEPEAIASAARGTA